MQTLIKNAQIVNEGKIYKSDVLIEDKIIKEIATEITIEADQIIDAEGLHLLPGVIDDQVHFREPGLTHKANIYTNKFHPALQFQLSKMISYQFYFSNIINK